MITSGHRVPDNDLPGDCFEDQSQPRSAVIFAGADSGDRQNIISDGVFKFSAYAIAFQQLLLHDDAPGVDCRWQCAHLW
jgi:hypothetical protein